MRMPGIGTATPKSPSPCISLESCLHKFAGRLIGPRNHRPPGARALALTAFFLLSAVAAAAQEPAKKPVARDDDLTLVRVSLTTESRGPAEPLVINGKTIPGYQPKIIRVFPSTGVVMDDDGRILTFLGYRYVDLQQADPRVEITTWNGKKYKGKLIGIDHVLGVAVVRASGGELRKTLVCRDCEIRDGDIVVAPALGAPGEPQFLNAQILSVGTSPDSAISGSWNITINRKLPGVGEALLDREFRVLGFVARQKPSREDPMGMRTVAYPIADLLDSADKIIKAGGSIRNGYLGVYVDDLARPPTTGVRIKGVIDDSPAQKAGLRPQDTIVSWNGSQVRDELQFIRMVQESPAGSKVTVGVVRQGRPTDLQAVIQPRQLADKPDTGFVFSFPDQILQANLGYGYDVPAAGEGSSFWEGIETAPLTPQMADFMKIPGRTGVLVLNVDSSMPFSRAGIKAGDVIVTVNGQAVDNPQSFFAHLKMYSRNTQQIIVKMLRKGVEQMTTIQLPLAPSRPRKSNK